MAPSLFNRYSLYGDDIRALAPEFLHIEPISARSSRFAWTIAPHTHPGIFQAILLERGSGCLTADEGTSELRPGALATIPSGSIHAFTFAPDAEGWVLSIANDLLVDLAASDRFQLGKLAVMRTASALQDLNINDARRLSWLFGEIAVDFAEAGAGNLSPARLAALNCLLALCAEVQETGPAVAAVAVGTDARREQLVQRFRALVDVHFRDNWPVSRYADALGASVPTLARACQATLRKSPGELVLDRIQLEAMRALTFTSSSISGIAADLRFADPAYFARFFKRRAGISASQFRKERAWLDVSRP
jgi:AraC family transcriptional activator of pobA